MFFLRASFLYIVHAIIAVSGQHCYKWTIIDEGNVSIWIDSGSGPTQQTDIPSLLDGKCYGKRVVVTMRANTDNGVTFRLEYKNTYQKQTYQPMVCLSCNGGNVKDAVDFRVDSNDIGYSSEYYKPATRAYCIWYKTCTWIPREQAVLRWESPVGDRFCIKFEASDRGSLEVAINFGNGLRAHFDAASINSGLTACYTKKLVDLVAVTIITTSEKLWSGSIQSSSGYDSTFLPMECLSCYGGNSTGQIAVSKSSTIPSPAGAEDAYCFWGRECTIAPSLMMYSTTTTSTTTRTSTTTLNMKMRSFLIDRRSCLSTVSSTTRLASIESVFVMSAFLTL